MPETTHCDDCCCARAWEALGVTEYDGLSIPEHIALLAELNVRLGEQLGKTAGRLTAENARLQAFVDKLPLSGDGVVLTAHCGTLLIVSPNTGGEIEWHRQWELTRDRLGNWLVKGRDAAEEHNEHCPCDCYSTREAARKNGLDTKPRVE